MSMFRNPAKSTLKTSLLCKIVGLKVIHEFSALTFKITNFVDYKFLQQNSVSLPAKIICEEIFPDKVYIDIN